jgi:DNA repair protein RecO (recombination protein O)
LRIPEDSRQLAKAIATLPIAEVQPDGWQKSAHAELRRFLIREIESHAERRLLTAEMLEAL